jgi:hypothetical protein
MLHKILREIGTELLAIALVGSGEQIKDKFFLNISKMAAMMIQEDMGYVHESMGYMAKQEILAVCFSVMAMSEKDYVFKQTVEQYTTENPEGRGLHLSNATPGNYDEENTHIVLVYGGTGKTAGTISVMLFNSSRNADNFCDYINGLKTAPVSFVYVRRRNRWWRFVFEGWISRSLHRFQFLYLVP